MSYPEMETDRRQIMDTHETETVLFREGKDGDREWLIRERNTGDRECLISRWKRTVDRGWLIQGRERRRQRDRDCLHPEKRWTGLETCTDLYWEEKG
jgi:hypothetical protein